MPLWLKLSPETPEIRRVVADDFPPLVDRHVDEHLVDDLARVGPVVAVVGEVGRPGHVLDAHLMALQDAVAVDDEGGKPVIAEVLARHLLQVDPRPDAVAPEAVVGHLEEVRDPADSRLDRRHAQLREAIEDALEDQLGDERHGVREGAGAERRGGLLGAGDLRLLRGEEQVNSETVVSMSHVFDNGVDENFMIQPRIDSFLWPILYTPSVDGY